MENYVKIEYDPLNETVTIKDDTDYSMVITIDNLLDQLPTEKVRVEHILWKIDSIRKEKIQNLGDFQQRIIDLVKKEAQYRQKLDDLMHSDEPNILAIRNDDKMRASYIKAYGELIKACLTEKNTLTEFRHAQKFLTNEEARFMVLLARLE
jgi:hypothetical protein